jgi:uncharacterized protein (TIGR03492 family)
MELLCLSNGHGEDGIGVKIAQQLQQCSRSTPATQASIRVSALPIVGVGRAYAQAQIPLLQPGQVLPSGGFIYMDNKALWQDLRGGLLPLAWQQLQLSRAWAARGGKILAVGDIVPLLLAWLSGGSYAFVGTAKSNYYRNPQKSDYYPWERWLMAQPRCRAVFPRDTPTAKTLQGLGIQVFDLGNPMMDGLASGPVIPSPGLTVLLLPGSRPPEAYRNWSVILAGAASLLASLALGVPELTFFAAIDPNLDVAPLREGLQAAGWIYQQKNRAEQDGEQQTWGWTDAATGQTATLILAPAGFQTGAHRSDLALAMAGTATEQFAGLGKPVISLPGQGPQFTLAFAQRQTQLLGCSVTLVTEPAQVGTVARQLLQDPQRLAEIAVNGRTRMGHCGASQRIAHRLCQIWGEPD